MDCGSVPTPIIGKLHYFSFIFNEVLPPSLLVVDSKVEFRSRLSWKEEQKQVKLRTGDMFFQQPGCMRCSCIVCIYIVLSLLYM